MKTSEWNIGISYSKNDIVSFGGKLFFSRIDKNLGNQPIFFEADQNLDFNLYPFWSCLSFFFWQESFLSSVKYDLNSPKIEFGDFYSKKVKKNLSGNNVFNYKIENVSNKETEAISTFIKENTGNPFVIYSNLYGKNFTVNCLNFNIEKSFKDTNNITMELVEILNSNLNPTKYSEVQVNGLYEISPYEQMSSLNFVCKPQSEGGIWWNALPAVYKVIELNENDFIFWGRFDRVFTPSQSYDLPYDHYMVNNLVGENFVRVTNGVITPMPNLVALYHNLPPYGGNMTMHLVGINLSKISKDRLLLSWFNSADLKYYYKTINTNTWSIVRNTFTMADLWAEVNKTPYSLLGPDSGGSITYSEAKDGEFYVTVRLGATIPYYPISHSIILRVDQDLHVLEDITSRVYTDYNYYIANSYYANEYLRYAVFGKKYKVFYATFTANRYLYPSVYLSRIIVLDENNNLLKTVHLPQSHFPTTPNLGFSLLPYIFNEKYILIDFGKTRLEIYNIQNLENLVPLNSVPTEIYDIIVPASDKGFFLGRTNKRNSLTQTITDSLSGLFKYNNEVVNTWVFVSVNEFNVYTSDYLDFSQTKANILERIKIFSLPYINFYRDSSYPFIYVQSVPFFVSKNKKNPYDYIIWIGSFNRYYTNTGVIKNNNYLKTDISGRPIL